eukprot:3054950-Prymnesium_polylepis.1
MSTLAEKLRISCEANGLGVSGSSSVLLARLVKCGNNEKKRPKGKTTASTKKMVCNNGVCKPMKTSPVKVNNKGARLSASYYYHEMCGGKLKNCKPQIIQEPSGRRRLKDIKIVDGAYGKHPRWVLCE